jgi:hypothetical protein
MAHVDGKLKHGETVLNPYWSLETNHRNDHNLGHECGLMG